MACALACDRRCVWCVLPCSALLSAIVLFMSRGIIVVPLWPRAAVGGPRRRWRAPRAVFPTSPPFRHHICTYQAYPIYSALNSSFAVLKPSQVFDMLLRRYLALRDGGGTLTAGESTSATAESADRRSTEPPTSDEAAVTEQHAVMASVVVLAERLGARVFGTGMQMLSCIRLVLEHEQPRGAGAEGAAGVAPGSGSGDGYFDAAARVARMEAIEQEGAAAAAAGKETGIAEGGLDLGRAGQEGEDGGDSGDTLCSVVLALLTTILELGEEERTAEEETELRAMLGPLKVR